jgi:hypothetical protein
MIFVRFRRDALGNFGVVAVQRVVDGVDVTPADVCEISGDAGGERNYHQRANEKRKFEMTLNWIWRLLSRARLASAGRSITRALIISSKQRQIASVVHHENENEQIAFALANKGDRTPA